MCVCVCVKGKLALHVETDTFVTNKFPLRNNRCFLELSKDRDALELAEQIQSVLLLPSSSSTNLNDAPLSTHSIDSQHAPLPPVARKSSSAQGPLFAQPSLLQGEQVILIEGLVSMACKLNARTVQVGFFYVLLSLSTLF